MAWVLQSSMEEEHNKGFTFYKNSYFQFENMREYMGEIVLNGEFPNVPNFHQGYKYPIPEHPFEMATSYKPDEFLSFMKSVYGLMISQSVVDLIEELQPNVHQFFPVNIRLDCGDELPMAYYFLNVCGVVQSIDYDSSAVHLDIWPENLESPRKFNTRMVTLHNKAIVGDPFRKGSVFIDKSKIEGRALWAEDGLRNLICSEEFLDQINNIGGLGAYKVLTRLEEY